MNEFSLDKNYIKGDSGPYVWIIQEWLCLHGINIVIDGIFGSATEAGIRKFQLKNSLTADGMVGSLTYAKLIGPLTNALKPIPVNGQSLRSLVTKYALQHLKQHPREVGSQKMGPWVRHYMNGNQGPKWPWCTGFVSAIITQASKSVGASPAIEFSVSCSELANNARKNELFLSERAVLTERTKLKPGYIFLNREFPGHWTHTGIVLTVEDDIIQTIEANTNDEGSAEGYEVCRRIRNYDGKDFIIV